MTLSLISPAFKANGVIPKRHTCDGENASPPFAWSGAPKETQSFVLVCTDPDAPGGVFHHWAVYDIPAALSDLPQGFSSKGASGAAKEAMNDFRTIGYGGPCPPHGRGPHHYRFRLSAVRTSHLPLKPGADCRAVIETARRQAVETAEIVGVYER